MLTAGRVIEIADCCTHNRSAVHHVFDNLQLQAYATQVAVETLRQASAVICSTAEMNQSDRLYCSKLLRKLAGDLT